MSVLDRCRVRIWPLLLLCVVASCYSRNTVVVARLNTLDGAWRVIETASRAPGREWETQRTSQGGLYVFAAGHYSYFYVRGANPRTMFADANNPTAAEKAAAFDSFIAGAGSYTLEGSSLLLKADFRKNPNEMTGEVWRLEAQVNGDTLKLVFDDPPFLPGRQWRTTLVRASP